MAQSTIQVMPGSPEADAIVASNNEAISAIRQNYPYGADAATIDGVQSRLDALEAQNEILSSTGANRLVSVGLNSLGLVTGAINAADGIKGITDDLGHMQGQEAALRGFQTGLNGAIAYSSGAALAGGAGTIAGFSGLAAAGIAGLAVAAVAVLANEYGGTGKSRQQLLQDKYKRGLESYGLITSYDQLNKDGTLSGKQNVRGYKDVTGSTRLIQLADGSYYNFEETEHGTTYGNGISKTIYDPTQLDEEFEDNRGKLKNNEVRANFVDHTNSLDFWTSRAADGLASIQFGKGVTQDEGTFYMRGSYTNAATSNIKDREWNEANFNKAMDNMQKFYEDSGVTYESAVAGSKELFAAGVITAEEHAINLEGFDLVFNRNFEYANEFETGQRAGRGKTEAEIKEREQQNIDNLLLDDDSEV